MPRVVFTANIQQHVSCPEVDAPGATVAEMLENARSWICA